MSKKRRYQPSLGSQSKNFARSSSSAHQRFSSETPMWLGTMSSMISRPASRSARRPSSPPSVSDTRVGSTTS